jgi:copper chaperone
MTRIYRVAGMTCEGCVRAITRAIVRRAPEAGVTVDLARQQVTVAGEVAPDAVAAAVADAGFWFGGPAEAAA